MNQSAEMCVIIILACQCAQISLSLKGQTVDAKTFHEQSGHSSVLRHCFAPKLPHKQHPHPDAGITLCSLVA